MLCFRVASSIFGKSEIHSAIILCLSWLMFCLPERYGIHFHSKQLPQPASGDAKIMLSASNLVEILL